MCDTPEQEVEEAGDLVNVERQVLNMEIFQTA